MISWQLKRTREAFEWDTGGLQCVPRRSSVSAPCTVIAYSFAIEGSMAECLCDEAPRVQASIAYYVKIA
jgi:hypothetical protein